MRNNYSLNWLRIVAISQGSVWVIFNDFDKSTITYNKYGWILILMSILQTAENCYFSLSPYSNGPEAGSRQPSCTPHSEWQPAMYRGKNSTANTSQPDSVNGK